MDLGLKDHKALVTGATSGIGRRVVEALVAEGARVVGHGHTAYPSLAAWCGPLGVPTVQGDLTDPEQSAHVVREAARELGGLDIVVANAGRWPEPDLRLDQTPVEALRRALDDNLWSAMLTARAFFAVLDEHGPRPDGAALVFVGSTAGRFGERGHSAYAAAKSALHGLVATLKNEIVSLDPSGRVNGVQPGWTLTPSVARHVTPDLIERVTRTMPLRQIGRVDDIARAVLFLCAPATSRHVSGEWITVAGGMEGRLLHP
jgi:3-oxoacyl-[acyl-carrier protein] reductase